MVSNKGKSLIAADLKVRHRRHEYMELWMSIVGISMSLAGLPQVLRMWKRKTSGDISIILWVILIHGIAWWLIYGIVIGSISLIITNSVCLILDSIVLSLVIKYREKSNKQFQTDAPHR